ncbi:MAG TPA: hypothetical protein VEC36_02740, partial [Patescibacteria group bacterium]|nr:hypothetical protein [Patescibacteria group bacterium]
IASAARNPQIAEAAFIYEDSLAEIRARGTTTTIELYRYRILLYALQISHQYARAIEICNEAQDFLASHPPYNTKSLLGEFIFTALNCSIALRDYGQCIRYGQQLLEFQPKGKRNWYATLHRVLMAALHNGDYRLALDLYKTALEQKGIDNLSPFEQEKWKLCRGYLFLLLESGTVHSIDKKIYKEFTIPDLIATLPAITKDKSGLNIQLHVLQIMYYLFIGQYDLASNKTDLFNRYAQRYLNNDENHRTLTFLAMLKRLKTLHFDIEKATVQCATMYEELVARPEKPEHFVEFNEILPYEVIWQWILHHCRLRRFQLP